VHELAITQNILDLVLGEAHAVQASRINKVNLVIGELSGVVRESVEFYFDFLRKDSVAESAILEFKMIPGQLRCRDCQTDFTPQDSLWICPHCQSSNVDLVAGRDCYIESIEVE
jgi:hydrogenase nickel incorporation protein HypA/HybF